MRLKFKPVEMIIEEITTRKKVIFVFDSFVSSLCMLLHELWVCGIEGG